MNKLKGFKSRNLGLASLFIAVFLLFGWIAIGQTQESKVDVNALTYETQRMSNKQGEATLIWWIPEEYWRFSFGMTEEFIKVFRPYIVLIVVDSKVGPFGAITYTPEATIRATIQIRDSEGVRYRPLNEDTISPDSKNFSLLMKPVFANMLEPMGQNMHLFLFPAENKRGQKIAEAEREGSFSVELGEREFRWRLPLGSLLTPKKCSTCGEK